MDIRQLETFVWIARLGGMTEACKRLNVTQSTLSMRIRGLESDLGVRLFDRSRKRLTLTAKGRDLVRHAEQIVSAVQRVRLSVADPTTEFGTLRIGMSEFVALSWGPSLLRRFSKQFPKVLIDLEVGVPGALMELLAAGQLDVLLATVPIKPGPPIALTTLGTVEYSWMASPTLGLPEKMVTPEQLKDFPVISYDGRRSIFFPAVQQWFADHGVAIQHLTVCNSLATSISLIVEGMGVGILPNIYCAPLIKAGKLQVLHTQYIVEHEYYAMCRVSDDRGLPSMVADMAQTAFTDYQNPPAPVRGKGNSR
ncbi:MAG TPA: LysR family transcriptional regulator [Steroidobacteraceae bacterium]